MAARRTWLATLPALMVLAGCGSIDLAATTPPPLEAPTTPSTMSPAFLKAVLLSTIDIPGSAEKPPHDDEDDEANKDGEAPPSAGAGDAKACFDDLPGAEADPNEVIGPDLVVGEGRIQRHYSSMATQAPPEVAASVVAIFGSPKGVSCLLETMKSALSADDGPVRVDPSGLKASTAPAAVGEGGALITVSGDLKARGMAVPMALEVLVFHKARAVVFLMAMAAPGAPYPVRVNELAQRVAARLL